MAARGLDRKGAQALEQVLGYLNFSSGASDPQFHAALNTCWESCSHYSGGEPLYGVVLAALREKIPTRKSHEADDGQAGAVIELLERHVLPGYLDFHRDLLFHQTAERLFNPFFVGRVCEQILREGGPWTEPARIVPAVIERLNDFIGHRPVATLENQKVEPYPHESVRPVPLFIRGAGVVFGPARPVIQRALEILEATDPDILREACFDPARLDELAVDPRAYDFDHPANKRPNYHFGQWDPHVIDNKGFYRRYVAQEVALEALMRRVELMTELSREELEFEAAAVLAGTILMAAGVSGAGPDSHSSSVTLSTLLPRIAVYRDEFYERLLAGMPGKHADRLRRESKERKQPFGAARQHLNAELACRRASQLEHVHLARIFARMGFAAAATRQVNVVPTASARMLCQIDCWLTELDLAIRRGDPQHANSLLPRIIDFLQRGIECGAVIDPRNILGFDANFSLFPALENSVHDHRADELVRVIEQTCNGYARVWSEFAARDQKDRCREVARAFRSTAEWWHRFAAHEVICVEAIDSLDAYRAAEKVAEALNLWHKGGAAAGDVGFWAPYAEMFDSSRAYALVIDALLEKNDFVASLALLVHWLSQAEKIPLHVGESSFHVLAEHWLLRLVNLPPVEIERMRLNPTSMLRRMLDFFEANAESYWEVPQFQLNESGEAGRKNREGSNSHRPAEDDADESQDPLDEDAPASDELFNAAYEEMVYRDTTDDGMEGAVFESNLGSHDELAMEADRVVDRAAFIGCLARLWKSVVTCQYWSDSPTGDARADKERQDAMERWRAQAEVNRERLVELLDTIQRIKIPLPRTDMDSMLEFDNRRATKESLLDQIVSITVEVTDAERILAAALDAAPKESRADDQDQRQITAVLAAILKGDRGRVREYWPNLIKSLASKPLLYVPLGRGGHPRVIVATRVRQRGIQDLLAFLPRLGLIRETCELLDVSRRMETDHPVGHGAVTEFDELFKRGYKAIVESLVASSSQWGHGTGRAREETSASMLVACLEKLTESLLLCWLNHSRTLRLSVLEKVHDKQAWEHMLEFIQRFGSDRFTQRFLNLGNIRSILHQGVDNWLDQAEESDDEFAAPFLAAIQQGTSRLYIVEHLTLLLEAIFENYGEYRDYNSTTTQSDRGELIYTLLDFLRLRTRYDRVAWNLKPVVWAHEVLVRAEQNAAAKMWRRALTDRINSEADHYGEKLSLLQKKYSMRMPTIADQVAERFVRPMAIDRIRALVEPAIREATANGPRPVFELLEHEAESLTRRPTGVGLDVPAWLVALEDEVEAARDPLRRLDDAEELRGRIPQCKFSLKDANDQLDQLQRRNIDERK